MQALRDQAVLILGLGISGLAMARWCASHGADVTVADTREAPPQLAALREQVPQARFVCAPMAPELLQVSGARAVFRSPGLSPAELAPVLSPAKAQGLWVAGELDLFTQALDELRRSREYTPQVLAITGTNGKTTVTALTGLLLTRSGRRAVVAGNIGPSLLDTLDQALRADSLPEVWVLELSSFQLDGVQGFEPSAATVLNLSQDHLDWHGDMQSYAAAKARIFGSHAAMLLNRDDPLVMAMAPAQPSARGQAARQVITFGADLPQRAGDYGIEVVAGMAWLVRALPADETRRSRRGSADEPELHIQRLMPAEALRIRGRHNAVNALAALALAHSSGSPIGPMLYGLRDYRGEPHRVEPVAIVGDVEYFDDSKGTNVGATVAALKGLGAERRLVVILGGDGKGQDFTPLVAPLVQHARAVVLIGRDAPLLQACLQAALRDAGIALMQATSLPEAVTQAREAARTGDAVLLSPACASLDMFDNYAHRARVFRAAVQALALDLGVPVEGLA